jgi:hypothetical protein
MREEQWDCQEIFGYISIVTGIAWGGFGLYQYKKTQGKTHAEF